MTDIFLSYSSKDRERVKPVHDVLVAMGYSVFWDQTTPAGVNWNKWIMEHLGRAKVVIVAWSKNSAQSDNVFHEVSVAKEDGKLVPYMLDALTVREFPMGFYTTQAAMLTDWKGEAAHKGYVDLMVAVRTRLGGGVVAAEVVRQGEAADIADLRRRANAGEVSAQAQLGYRYDVGNGVAKDDREAAQLYRLAAVQGHASAQFNLGLMYANGRGVAKDEAEAVRLYRLATDQGYASAQFGLGFMYETGRGVTKDEAEAVRLFRLAADQGEAGAQAGLGTKYENGRGVAKDEAEAVRLYRLAADQGRAEGQAFLAEMYENGKGGLESNLEEAVRWYRLAADQHNQYAINALKRLGK